MKEKLNDSMVICLFQKTIVKKIKRESEHIFLID